MALTILTEERPWYTEADTRFGYGKVANELDYFDVIQTEFIGTEPFKAPLQHP